MTFFPILSSILVFLINSIALTLVLLVIFNKPKKEISWLFFFQTILTITWVNFAYYARTVSDNTLSLALIKIAWIATPGLVTVTYFFIRKLVEENSSKFKIISRFATLGSILLGILTTSSTLVISQIDFINARLYIQYGQGVWMYIGFILFMALINLSLLIKNQHIGDRKEAITLLFVGFLSFFFLNGVFNLVLPIFFKVVHLYEFGDYSSLILLGTTAYAILRHDLFQLDMLFTTLLISVLGNFMVIDIVSFSSGKVGVYKFIMVIIYLLIAYVLVQTQLLSQKQRETLEATNKSVMNKNKELDTIFEITNKIVTTLDPHEVAKRAVDSVPSKMDMVGAIIVVDDPEYDAHKILAVSDSPLNSTLFDISQKYEWISPIAKNNTLSRVPSKKNEFLIFDTLLEGIPILADSKFSKIITKELGISHIVNYPILVRGDRLGVVSFILTKEQMDRVDQSSTEYNLMKTLVGQVGIGLENARLFDQYIELTQILKEKNDDLAAFAEKERDILDIMGHELRTPITIVRNALSMLSRVIKEEDKDMDRINHYLEIALKSARREINIIETMLASTKVEGGKIELHLGKVNPSELISEALLGQEDMAKKKGLQIITNIEENLSPVYADRSRSQEIIDNFLSNAVKYTLEGTITIDVSSNDGFVVFKVSDTGLGIPEDLIDRLGTKFFRVSQHIKNDADSRLYNVVRPGGTGLGLFVTFSLVKLHGGKVDIKSEENKGSTFTFTLPKYTGQEVRVSPKASKDLLQEYKKRKNIVN